MLKPNILIGTSGWHYPHWTGRFYPNDLPKAKWLEWYARHFACVELNNSFYRLPKITTIQQWLDQTPEDFVFTIKASRLITHLKKLRNCKDQIDKFLDTISHFGNKLGPILFQLPPHWHINVERLETFLDILPAHFSCVFEFRDSSWHDETIYRLLSKYQASFCMFELAHFRSPEIITSDIIYIRLHGPDDAYCGSYSQPELQSWAKKIHQWSTENRLIYLFFDNDQAAYAAKNALTLKALFLK